MSRCLGMMCENWTPIFGLHHAQTLRESIGRWILVAFRPRRLIVGLAGPRLRLAAAQIGPERGGQTLLALGFPVGLGMAASLICVP